MPTKTAANGTAYQIDGKRIIWPTESGDEITLPLRLRLGTLRKIADRELDASAMFDILDEIAPGQSAVYDEMDLHDFQAMFVTWQTEYQALSGATLGE